MTLHFTECQPQEFVAMEDATRAVPYVGHQQQVLQLVLAAHASMVLETNVQLATKKRMDQLLGWFATNVLTSMVVFIAAFVVSIYDE